MLRVVGRVRRLRCVVVVTSHFSQQIRYISKIPDETYTKLSDENDPERDAFFKYSWGSWLKNDKEEKEKRLVRFSIEGLNAVLNDLHVESNLYSKDLEDGVIPLPNYKENFTVSLPHNIVKYMKSKNPNEKVQVTSMSSIHEGKHHRIYKIDTNLEKSFVLRIPYSIDNEVTLGQRLRSEVATIDFVDLKLGIKVPKIYCFSGSSLNPIRQPFILQEFIDGKLLMKDWNPLETDSEEGNIQNTKLNKVIDPLSKFQSQLASVTFNKFGSLYFASDINMSNGLPYEDETNPDLLNRWGIGPSVERCFWRKKSALNFETQKKFMGPWDILNPLDIIKDVGLIELENTRSRLALKQANAKSEYIDQKTLEKQIYTFERLSALAPTLLNLTTDAIPNIEELLKPRLFHPDLDPMNVIIKSDKESTPYLIDFEGASIKPFILQSNPQFVAYDGPKIYNLKKDVDNYKNLSDSERTQYEFMYKRTRNQYLWELSINKNLKHLVSSVAPPVKLLKSPYITAIERKSDQEYLLIDEAMIQLRELWKTLAENGLVASKQYPIEYSIDELKQHSDDLDNYHKKLVTEPFSATQGWIPQDMFENLIKSGSLVEDKNGDYSIKA